MGYFTAERPPKGINTMSEIASFLKRFTSSPAPMDDNALRRRIRELESENRQLREKLVFHGPWMF
jgi:hypothetical protein